MKNKKMFTIGAAVVLSGVLLATTALTGNAAGNAWEQFKELARTEHTQPTSMAMTGTVTVTDNGQQVAGVTASVKADHENDVMSGTFTLVGSDASQTVAIYKNGDDVLMNPQGSDNWYKIVHEPEATDYDEASSDDRGTRGMRGMKGMRSNHNDMDNTQMRESVMDALMGDLKDQVTVVEANGLRTFSLTLDENNMPVLLQTAFTAGLSSNHGKMDSRMTIPENLPEELKTMMTNGMNHRDMTKIVSEGKLIGMSVAFTVNAENQPTAFDVTVQFKGLDADGVAHTMGVSASAAISDYNNTTPDTADTTGKTIITIEKDAFEGMNEQDD